VVGVRGFKPATPKSRPRRGGGLWQWRPLVIVAATPTSSSLNGIRGTHPPSHFGCVVNAAAVGDGQPRTRMTAANVKGAGDRSLDGVTLFLR
jgi:hypothetical protein